MYEEYEASIKSYLINKRWSTAITLDYFIRAYSMLSNFVEFLELRGFKHWSVYYRKIPLQGALDIFSKIITNSCTDLSKQIKAVIMYFTDSLTTRKYSTPNVQSKSMLFELADSPCVPASKKLQLLSVLLRETAENIVRNSQVEEPPAHIQTKTLLNLVSNFIREWGERPRGTRSHLKICKFCDSVITGETRQCATKYCCIQAEQLNRLSNEWLSLYTLQNSSIFETVGSPDAKINFAENVPWTAFKGLHNTGNAELLFADKDNTSALEDDRENRDGSRSFRSLGTVPTRTATRNAAGTRAKQRHNIPDTSRREFDSGKVGRPVQSGAVVTDHRDGIAANGDLSDANGDRSLERGKTVTSAGGARSDGGARNTGTVAERIRGEERDNNPYRRGRAEVGDKDRQDRHRSARRDVEEEANRSRTAAGKRRRDGDAEDDAMAMEENAGERGNPGRSPYQYPRGRERERRSPDNSAWIRRRSDRVDEKSAPIELSWMPAKGLEVERDGNGRRDRHENEEQPVTRRDRRKARRNKNEEEEEEGTASLSENKQTQAGSKRTMNSLDGAGKGRFVVNEEEELPASDEMTRRGASNDGRHNSEKTKVRRVGNNPSNPIEYRLSDAHFVKLGWTLLPVTRTMRKIVQYEARPAKPNLDWFKRYRHRDTEYYNDGRTSFIKFYPNGSGEVFYPNGVLAIRVYRPENRKYDMYTVFTPGGKDTVGIERRSQILAIFDTTGNGVVFDEDGVARLSYNQIGGIFTDNPTGRPLVWTWSANPKESILETVYTEKSTDRLQMEFFPSTSKLMNSSGNVKTPISPSSSRNKEKKVVEVQKPVVEERQEEVGSKSEDHQDDFLENIFHIKTIYMKLNKFLSLRIIDRRNISLRFSAGKKSIRIELGTIVNFNKEVASRMIEASDWKSDMLRCKFQEKLSAKLAADDSLCDLTEEYRKVKRFARERKILIAKYKAFSKL